MGIERIPPLPSIGSGIEPYYGASRRNLLVNGDVLISQRYPVGNTWLTSDGVNVIWLPDRWAMNNAAVGLQQFGYVIPGGPLQGSSRAMYFSAPGGSTVPGIMYFGQAIESAKVTGLSWLPITLSFWAVCGGTFSPTYWASQTLNGVTAPLLAITQSGTGLNEGTFGAYTGSAFFIILGVTPTTRWQRYTKTGLLTGNVNELKVYFQLQRTSTAFDGGAWIQVTDVQLEVGTQATPFDKIPFDQSLAECQRFYQKTFSYAVQPAQNTGDYTGALSGVCIVSGIVNLPVWVNYKRPMMKAPVATFYNPAAANANWRNTARGADSGPGAIVNAGDSAATVIDTQIAGDGAGQTLAVHMALSADF